MSYKKKIILLASVLFISSFYIKDKTYAESSYEIVDDNSFATSDNGCIYIGKEDYLNSIDSISDDDILILDQRDQINPSIKIYSSYKITNSKERNKIIAIIEEYEKKNPSNWNRSTKTMRLEWLVHNILYYFDYETNRTKDVDFENDEEELYKKLLLFK
ncbi:MAG: hypothetical protein IJ572_04040 [Bacilli bacterium]|nr:hypothetical protein [Bacilli bacterium]